MKAKRIECFILTVLMVCLTTACAGGGAGGGVQSNLAGSAEDILVRLLADIEATGVEMPMALPPSEVPPDISQNTAGLSEADFGRLIESSSYSLAAIGTFAHQIIVFQANDAASAVEVKSLVSSDGGYDPHKWICVWPDKAAAVDSGAYVLLAASYNDVVDAALAAFEAAAGNVGEVVTFWESDGSGIEGGEIGGMPIEIVPG